MYTGAKEDNSVVDPELKVYGVDNLRICDASIFPDSLSGHPVSDRAPPC
jgi:choline dehydrogenase